MMRFQVIFEAHKMFRGSMDYFVGLLVDSEQASRQAVFGTRYDNGLTSSKGGRERWCLKDRQTKRPGPGQVL